MPFTATHVAAVIPVAWLCRWRVPLSALAIGSMVPDVAGYFPNVFNYESTHSVQGVITHSVPLGLFGFYLFHLLLKRPLVELLPEALASRLRGWNRTELDVKPERILIVSACVAFGALTHVVWDAFTHGGSWGVAMFPSLKNVAFTYYGRPIPAYDLLQHGSSLLLLPPMLVGFLWWAVNQPRTTTIETQRMSIPRWITWTAVAMLVVGTWIYFQSLMTHMQLSRITALSVSVKHCGAVAIVVMLLYCVSMQLVWWYQSPSLDDEDFEYPTGTFVKGQLRSAEPAHEILKSRRSRGSRPSVTRADAAHES